MSFNKPVNSIFEYKPLETGAKVYSGFAFKSADLGDMGISVIKIGNLQNRIVEYSKTQYFPESKVNEKHNKFFLADKDVLIAMTGQGSVGRVARIRMENGQRILLNQRVGKFIVDNINLDNDYLYYIISSPTYENILFNAGTGSGQPNLSPQTIQSIEIPFPTLSEQQAIADTLSVLDDKIELNNRINKTLEEMAQTIFKSWFVDFEPFQDGEFEDSELGRIPKGWRVGSLGEIADINMGQSPSSTTYNTEARGVPFYQGVKDFGFKFPSILVYCNDPKKLAYVGDVLFSVRAPVGRLNVAYRDCCIGRGVASIRLKEYENNIAYYWMQSITRQFDNLSNGSIFNAINKSEIEKIKIAIPNDVTIINRLNKILKLIDEEILNNFYSINNLSTIRDSLLPKLMSGEIRVPIEEVEANGKGV